MPEHDEEHAAERLDRLVSDLLAGKHLKATPSDAEEQEAIRAAAQLAGSREGYPRMSSSFRGRLRGLLEKGEPAPWMNRRAALGLAAQSADSSGNAVSCGSSTRTATISAIRAGSARPR